MMFLIQADLENSLHLGISTSYTIQDVESESIFYIGTNSNLDFYNTPIICNSQNLFPLSNDLRAILIDTSDTSRLLNKALAELLPPLDSYVLHNSFILLGYRLISIHPLGGSHPSDPLEKAIHLGLTAFVSTFIRGLDGKVPNNQLLTRLIKCSVKELSRNRYENSEVLIWLLLIGKASVFGDADNVWLAQNIKQAMLARSHYCWTDVLEILAKFL